MKNEFYKENSYYQGLIQNFYGGKSGCFRVFMNFFYQYEQSLVFDENLSELFQMLYKTELENCVILSKILLKTSSDCKFFSSGRKFLSGYDVDYTKNFSQIFLNDIELLEVGVIEVKNIISKIENLNTKAELGKILKNKKIELRVLRENYLKMNLIKKNN